MRYVVYGVVVELAEGKRGWFPGWHVEQLQPCCHGARIGYEFMIANFVSTVPTCSY